MRSPTQRAHLSIEAGLSLVADWSLWSVFAVLSGGSLLSGLTGCAGQSLQSLESGLSDGSLGALDAALKSRRSISRPLQSTHSLLKLGMWWDESRLAGMSHISVGSNLSGVSGQTRWARWSGWASGALNSAP